MAGQFQTLYRQLWVMDLGGITVVVAVIFALSNLFPK